MNLLDCAFDFHPQDSKPSFVPRSPSTGSGGYKIADGLLYSEATIALHLLLGYSMSHDGWPNCGLDPAKIGVWKARPTEKQQANEASSEQRTDRQKRAADEEDTTAERGQGVALHKSTCILLGLRAELSRHLASLTGEAKPGLVDEFVDGIRQMMKTGHVRIWLVVGCQTYMDLYDNIGRSALVATEDFLRLAADQKQVHDIYATFIGQFGHSDESAVVLSELDKLTEQAMWMAQRRSAESTGQQFGNGKLVETAEGTRLFPSGMFDTLPQSPACWLSHCITVLHTRVIYNAKDGIMMLFMAHVYRSLKHLNLLPCAWGDMEWFLAQRSAEKPFIKEVDRKPTLQFSDATLR